MPYNEIQATPAHFHKHSPNLNLTQPHPFTPTILHTHPLQPPPVRRNSPKNSLLKPFIHMGKRMKLPFLSHSKSLDPNLLSSPTWPWPSCGNIKTLSFRATNVKDDAFRTYNSAFVDTQITPLDSFFTVSSSSRSFSTMSEEDTGDPVETVIRGLSSDRFFFEPEKSSSLVSLPLEAKNQHQPLEENDEEHENEEEEEEGVAYKESELLSMESNNPYEDFRRSMEEMVEAHGLKDWQGLEELLRCYLKINGKNNHGYIVGAFIDLLVSFSFVSSPSNSTSTSSSSTTTITSSSSTCLSSSNSNYSSPSSPLSLPSSSLTTPCLSSILDDDDHHHDDSNNDDDDGNDGDDDDSS